MLLIVVFWYFNVFLAWANFSLQTLLFFRGRKRCYQRNESPLQKKNTLQTIWNKHETWNICNADEFELFYQTLSQKTFNLQKEKFTGDKLSKFRLTGLAAASTNGEKLCMFAIGKSEKPSCFKGIKKLSCRYWGQKKSWMNSEIF